MTTDNSVFLPMAPCVEDAVKEWEYQQSRIRYCERIIAEEPNSPKARNARWLIREIKRELGYPDAD